MNNSVKHSRLLIPGIFLLGACMRTPITSIPSIVKEIAQSFNIPETSLGILTTIPLICFGLFSVIIPAISRRWGNETTIAISLALLTIGSLMRIANYSMLIWGTILVGVAITFINVLLPALITDNLPTRVGSMTSLYNVALSLFSAIGAYAITPLVQASGWHFAVTILSLLPLITLLLWIPNLRFNHHDHQSSTKGANMWKNPRAWAMLIYFGASSFIFYTIVAWLPAMSESAGMSHTTASIVASLFQLFSLPASFAAPVLAARLQNRQIMVWVTGALVVIGTILLMLPISGFPYYALISALLGLGTAGTFSFTMTLFSLKTTNAADTSSLSGMVQSLGYFIAAIGPVIIGQLKAMTNNWTLSEIVMLIVTVLFIIAGLITEHRRLIN